MSNRIAIFWLALAVVMLAGLACNFTNRLTGQEDATPIPVSSAAVGEAEATVAAALATVQSGGPIFLEFSEAQLTSLAATYMTSMGSDNLSGLQVLLRNGRIILAGVLKRSGFDLPVQITIQPGVTADGRPQFQIVEAYAGPLPIPQSILDQLTATLEQMLLSQFEQGVVLQSIQVNEGKISILGVLR